MGSSQKNVLSCNAWYLDTEKDLLWVRDFLPIFVIGALETNQLKQRALLLRCPSLPGM
jgi:hypothetical protein